jgi:CheY-like chemotaxis protein
MPKILIADDSIAVRKVAERLLTEAGLGVTLAANGEEALAFLAKDRPDVIVSDVIMPDKSGYEICAFVRGNSALAATPVLLISGIVNEEVTKQAEACRADGILKKPFQGTSLKDKVLELLARRQASAPAQGMAAIQPAKSTRTAGEGFRIADQGSDVDRQTAVKLKEVEEELRAERNRSGELAKRIADLEKELRQSKDTETLLAAERQRATDLEAKVAALDRQASAVPQLEAALKAEQEVAAKLRLEVAGWQKASNRVTELEATLQAERAAATELVQQLTEYQQKAEAMETALAAEQAKVGDLSEKVAAGEQAVRRVRELEALLADHQRKGEENERRLLELGKAASKAQELESLLTTEREMNAMLARRVSEAELATQTATKRFEDMARKLSEIAGLASRLGNGRGQS